jgi:hypothetical protein
MASDIRGEARRKRKVAYLIHGGVALHLPHRFPELAQRSRAGSTRRRSRTLEGCDRLECSPLLPSFRRGVLNARACP